MENLLVGEQFRGIQRTHAGICNVCSALSSLWTILHEQPRIPVSIICAFKTQTRGLGRELVSRK